MTTAAPLTIARQGTFFIVGHYVSRGAENAMAGQMYVEFQIPAELKHPYPIVMIHGGGQTGNNFRSTPDGRPGWAEDFLSWGYAVYVVDQVGRGRSGLSPELWDKMTLETADSLQRRFTSSSSYNLWPQARLQTQWPGATGKMGDADYDQYCASTVPFIEDQAVSEELNVAALTQLFDQIGPAIMLGHSQAGTSLWRVADLRPELVKTIIAVEPNGPPFCGVDFKGAPEYFAYPPEIIRPYGISRGPLTFDPPLNNSSELACVQQEQPDGPDLIRGFLQREPARKLVNLAGIPIAIITTEASYHASYDHLTSAFLSQAGVANEFIRLEEHGIRGNGHILMLERNSRDIARLISDWIDCHLR